MSIGRTFWKVTRYARAARFWLLLALAALAWLGFGGDARAQFDNCMSGAYQFAYACPDRGAAYAGAKLAAHQANQNLSGNPGQFQNYAFTCSGVTCTVTATVLNVATGHLRNGQRTWDSNNECPPGTVWDSEAYTCSYPPCPAGQIRNSVTNACMESCTGRAQGTFAPQHGGIVPNGSVGCSNGCQFFSYSNGDGTYSRNWINDDAANHCSVVPNECTLNGAGYYLHPGLGMCVPPMPECAANEVRDPLTGECGAGCPPGMTQDATGACVVERDTCPAGHIRAPSGQCLPGEGQCAVGEARKPDGTCGRDSDNDGTPDEFDPDTDSTSFSGGDTCNAPPSCSGDPIMCGMARIQWRIECNTRDDATVSGGSCGAIPICTGKNCKALEYAQLLQQWRTSCALEKLGGGDGGDDGGPHSCGPGMSDAQCEASQNIGGEGDPGSSVVENEYFADGFDASGYGWSQSCPSIPPVTIYGNTIDFQSKIGPLCDWIQLGGVFLMIITGILCITILLRV